MLTIFLTTKAYNNKNLIGRHNRMICDSFQRYHCLPTARVKVNRNKIPVDVPNSDKRPNAIANIVGTMAERKSKGVERQSFPNSTGSNLDSNT